MDIDDWHKESQVKYPKNVDKVDYVYNLITEFPDNPNASGHHVIEHVKQIELDEGLLIAWERRGVVRHYIAPDNNTILERGIDKWPRGQVVKLDRLCKVLDGMFVGDKAFSQALDAFMITVPNGIGRVEHEKAAEKAARKAAKKAGYGSVKKAKKKSKR